MPGIVGFTRTDKIAFPERALESMYALLAHRAGFVRERAFHDENLCCGRCHPAIINADLQPVSRNGVFAWLSGEIYNRDTICGKGMAASRGDTEFILDQYRSGRLPQALGEADGIFAGVIYDSMEKTVRLFTDRYGLRYLFWTNQGRQFSWAEEYKAFLALPGFTPVIDPASLSDFLEHGFIRGEKTWFKGVNLLAPATIMAVDLINGRYSSETYWDWGRFKPCAGKFNVREYAEEWGRRLRVSVERRLAGDKKVGVFLSGGLDSRGILAAIPDDYAVHAVTFGIRRCREVLIAARVAQARKAQHHFFELSSETWFEPRIKGIWWSDGELNIIDQHGIEFLSQIERFFKVSFNGLGGAVHSGLTLSRTLGPLPTRECPFGEVGRRSARRGVLLDEPAVFARMPLYANDLMELILSVPEKFRAGGYFYRKALVWNFPGLFRRIPYQASGVPVSVPSPLYDLLALPTRAGRAMARMAGRIGLPFVNRTVYADYAAWLRAEPVRSLAGSLLTDKQGLLHAYLDREKTLRAWAGYLRRGDGVKTVSRLLTLEIWLRQVFSGTFRQGR
ncbi:MAG: hypothetical protein JW699_08440 [Chitinispirillaceae bacterium]|nr:hypothetical protein [Chitinispirillaceae bacterium]